MGDQEWGTGDGEWGTGDVHKERHHAEFDVGELTNHILERPPKVEQTHVCIDVGPPAGGEGLLKLQDIRKGMVIGVDHFQ